MKDNEIREIKKMGLSMERIYWIEKVGGRRRSWRVLLINETVRSNFVGDVK